MFTKPKRTRRLPELQSPVHLPEQTIPATIVIGVTGHRKLDTNPELSRGISLAIEEIRQLLPPLPNTPIALSILSPLAEGADRLVVQEILKLPGVTLEVVLPLKKEDYVRDFESSESRKEFEDLLSQARHIIVLPPSSSRAESYEHLGRYVVDQCDVLLSLWDGEVALGRGGTGDVVKYARESNRPLIWIHTEDQGKVTVEWGQGLNSESFQRLDHYNSEQVDATGFKKQLQYQFNLYSEKAKRAGLPSGDLRPIFEHALRHHIRADLLTQRYQRLYYGSETLVHVLATIAIAIGALQLLFFSKLPMILLSEIALMLAVLVVVAMGRRRQWHTKWIDYRFLAERFRSALFMAVANAEMTTQRPSRQVNISPPSNDWMLVAFSSFWSQRPLVERPNQVPLEKLRNFLCDAWLEDQVGYHSRTSERHRRWHDRLVGVSYALFGLTILAALLHIINIAPHPVENVFAFLAIVFPAMAANITAIRTHRDYLRTSIRSADMARHLKELKELMVRAQDHERFLDLMGEVEEVMLDENEDWHVIVRFHIPELPI